MQPDLILQNGDIHTMGRPGRVSALAAAGQHIAALGDDQTIRSLAGPATRVVDLGGRVALPGLIDAHVHFAWYGLSLSMVNLDGCRSLDECLRRLTDFIAEHRPARGAWIRGSGWNHNEWREPVFPTRHALDRIAPHNPIALRRKDGHSVWVNSLALRQAGVDAQTAAPEGGTVDREGSSEKPTGILRENAIGLIDRAISPPKPAELEQALLQAQQRALAAGLTGVHTMEGPEVFAALQRLDAAGKLVVRVCHSIAQDHLDEAIGLGLCTGAGNARLRIGGLKLFADGSLGSATAHMLHDYEGMPGERGVVTLGKDEMSSLVRQATAAGIAPVIHAIGDHANRDVLDIYEANRAGGDRLRYRIEHAQLVHPDDMPRFVRLAVIASMQPSHCPSDREAAMRLWGERSRYAYAWRSLRDAGAMLAFGSDCPVETIDPLVGIHAAVTRQRASEPDAPSWYPEQCLSVTEAVEAFTLGAAYASGEETSRGSLAVGKLADVVVLSQDIFTCRPQEIANTRVDMTIIGGTVAHRAT